MTIAKPHLLTKLPIWFPKYDAEEGWEVWIACSKVAYASPVILIDFTKAKHLRGQRFCITRERVEQCERGTNGKVAIFKVPFDWLESWDTAQEVHDLAELLFQY